MPASRKRTQTKGSRRTTRELRADHRELASDGDGGADVIDHHGRALTIPRAVQRLDDDQRADYFRLSELVRDRDDIDTGIRHYVTRLRGQGCSWALIGTALGTTGEGARKRYGLES